MQKFKRIVGWGIGIVIVVAIVWIGLDTMAKAQYIETHGVTASTTPKAPTRLEQTQDLINKLATERENDPSFKEESRKMQIELDQRIADMREALTKTRKAQARIDALMVIQTQYQVELAAISEVNKK